ncbi:MAG: hypothetical protein EBR88_00015 [Betaproteobacteria bacterium]|nr:hypothetical protein [Betaproteobacteria bacterium]
MTTIENVYDADGFDADGFNARGYDRDGYNADGYDFEGYDRHGYDSEGYDRAGYNEDGFSARGYDRDGYDARGRDSDGNTRCDNDECDDPECDTCADRAEGLHSSSANVLAKSRWLDIMQPSYRSDAGLMGLELEGAANDDLYDRIDVIRDIVRRFNTAYSEFTKGRMKIGSLCCRDGSLPSDTGLEFKTVPMLLAEWTEVLPKAFPSGYIGDGELLAWNVPDYSPDVGIHITLSGASCSRLTMGKMALFVLRPENSRWHIALAGRESGEYAAFAAYNASLKWRHPTRGNNDPKYQALHYKRPSDSAKGGLLEFRLFRSSARVATVLKNLSYVAALRDFCTQTPMTPSCFTADVFMEWLADNHHAYRFLHKWLVATKSSQFARYRARFTR